VRQCPSRADCPYAQIFKPLNPHNPSGLIDSPRPFVFRTRHLDGRSLQPGDDFYVDIHLFTRIHNIADHFRTIFAQFETAGFGFSRHRAALKSMEERVAPPLSLDPVQPGVTSLQVYFRTPTELKHQGTLTREPHFPALWNNACDRLSALSMLYGPQPLTIDFRRLRELAQHVRLAHCAIHRLKKSRRSTLTGQVHPLGGFVGTARYEGELNPFLPYLNTAQWTGVGRQTVWGKGEITLTISPAPPQTASS
jgi:CRISPR-associated endoribonuclease Cas6